jgi:hypothetical protein
MAEKNLFMYQTEGSYEQHKVVSVERNKAQELINAGKAVEVSLESYDEYRKKAQDAHKEYKKKENKIKQSENPLHTDEYKRYELDKAYKDYAEQTRQIQADWTQERERMQAEARAKAARASIHVSQSDKNTAEQVANRITLNVVGASNAAQLSEAVTQASEDISYLSDAEKTAIQGKLSEIISQIEAKADKYGVKISTKSLINKAQDVRNADLLAVKVAEQLPGRVDIEYRQKETVRKARKGGR